MTHPRTDIRDKIAERLKIIPKVKIFSGRSIPMFDQDLPAILVYTNNEQIITERWDTDGCGELTRELEIYIEAISSGRENLDNILDNIAEKIENSLDGWTIPNRKNAILRFKRTQVEHNIVGNKIYGAILLEYSLTYMTETHNDDID